MRRDSHLFVEVCSLAHFHEAALIDLVGLMSCLNESVFLSKSCLEDLNLKEGHRYLHLLSHISVRHQLMSDPHRSRYLLLPICLHLVEQQVEASTLVDLLQIRFSFQ